MEAEEAPASWCALQDCVQTEQLPRTCTCFLVQLVCEPQAQAESAFSSPELSVSDASAGFGLRSGTVTLTVYNMFSGSRHEELASEAILH